MTCMREEVGAPKDWVVWGPQILNMDGDTRERISRIVNGEKERDNDARFGLMEDSIAKNLTNNTISSFFIDILLNM